jgi:RNA polymerase sigma-70 factor (ECF subfamily)
LNSDKPLAEGDELLSLQGAYLRKRVELVRFLRARGAGEASEEIVQELWLKISASGERSVEDPVGYLYRAADNLLIDRYRSDSRAGRRDQAWLETSTAETDSIEAKILARQRIEAAESRLRALGQRVLRVFVMFRVNGTPQREIAQQLDISLSAVEKDLQRAYRAIADLRGELDAG